VTQRQSTILIILGAAAICASFVAGSWLALYLSISLPESGPVSWLGSAVPATDSPTVLESPSPSPSPSRGSSPLSTPSPPPPTPTSTWVVPPLSSAIIEPRQPVSPDEGEPDDTPAEARPAEIGVPQDHNLHQPGDQDWVYFQGEPGQTYEVRTSNLGREVDTVVSLYDGQGNELASDDDGGDEFRSSRVFWSVEEGGTLFIMIRGFGDTQGGPGTEYQVSVQVAGGFRVDEYEPDDSPDRATRVEVGETQRHNRHVSADEDWISFRAEAGRTYVVETSRLGERADTVLYLYDREGNELALDDDGAVEERASRLEWTAPDSRLFFVRVTNWLPTLAGPGTGYDLTLSTQEGSPEPRQTPSS
jgi:hypothetical protein